MKYRKKKQYDDDDGRVIAPMNVDGMPWYSRDKAALKPDKKEGETEEEEFDFKSLSPEEQKAYRKETRKIIWGILKRFMPIVFAFVAVFALVILFFWLIWR